MTPLAGSTSAINSRVELDPMSTTATRTGEMLERVLPALPDAAPSGRFFRDAKPMAF